MRFLHFPKDRIVWLLLVVSLLFYFVEYFFFGRPGEIVFGFVSNVAFLPVYVLFVTLMIERVLKEREREAMMQKLNMVIGVFFSEVGRELLQKFLEFYEDGKELSKSLRPTVHWQDGDFLAARDAVKGQDVVLDARLGDLAGMRQLLKERKRVMLTLLENPNLLEHDAFTDLLWAVLHLSEELQARRSLQGLPETDLAHLSGDMKRAHTYLLIEWISYLRHLHNDYPYLYSLAVRMNPMDPDARPEIV